MGDANGCRASGLGAPLLALFRAGVQRGRVQLFIACTTGLRVAAVGLGGLCYFGAGRAVCEGLSALTNSLSCLSLAAYNLDACPCEGWRA